MAGSVIGPGDEWRVEAIDRQPGLVVDRQVGRLRTRRVPRAAGAKQQAGGGQSNIIFGSQVAIRCLTQRSSNTARTEFGFDPPAWRRLPFASVECRASQPIAHLAGFKATFRSKITPAN